MLGDQQLIQQRLQLHLTPGTARLDVGQDPLQVANASGQRLHLAKPSMDLFEAIADQLEGFTKPLLERRMQLFIDCSTHLFELERIVALHRGEPCLKGQPQALETLLIAVGQARQLLRKGLQLLRLQLAELGQLCSQCLCQAAQRQRLLIPVAARGFCRLLPSLGQFLAQFALESIKTALNVAPARIKHCARQSGTYQHQRLQRDHHDANRQRDIQQAALSHAPPLSGKGLIDRQLPGGPISRT